MASAGSLSSNYAASDRRHRDARTPPKSSTALPLTPPPSIEKQSSLACRVHEALKACVERATWTDLTIHLPPQEYTRLKEKLAAQSPVDARILDQIRLNYDLDRYTFSACMPSPIHDCFSTSVAREIDKHIEAITHKDHVPTAAFARQIRNAGSSRVVFRHKNHKSAIDLSELHPDAQFQHRDAVYPGVIIEISYSRGWDDLRRKARQYIKYSSGEIQMVIGFDIHDKTKDSTVSVWRPKFLHKEGESDVYLEIESVLVKQPFRPPSEKALHLKLTDFATAELCQDVKPVEIKLTFHTLATFLDTAEELLQSREGDGNGVTSNRKEVLWAGESSSSSEELDSDDERSFVRKENAAADAADLVDGDFRLSSRGK